MNTFQNPSDDELKLLLQSIKTIAVVGLSPKPDRPSYEVAKLMQDYGYKIIPVRPATDEILGEKVYRDLASVDRQIDLVNVFLNPSRLDALVDACIGNRAPAIWLQEGVVNEAAALRAQQAGIKVVMDRCVYKDYERLLGK